MEVNVPSGKYIMAVSGGVDSMSLLDLLSKQKGLELIVAHFNHGIRPEATQDERLVRKIAGQKGLIYEGGQGNLGSRASEEAARTARYQFLDELVKKHQAKAIITGHHQDDLIETAFINLVRGTHRRGLSAIADSDVVRPLLQIPKKEILSYARANNLKWLEDRTNNEDTYLRNYLRNNIMVKLTERDKAQVLGNIEEVAVTNNELDKLIATISQSIESNNVVDRAKFIALPTEVADEVMTAWLRKLGARNFDRHTVRRLSIALKTAKAGTTQPIKGRLKLKIQAKKALFTTTD